jgi:DNA-binding SARP family transcriptional activator
MSIVRCQTLGPVGVSVNGGPAPPELLWRKHLALLIYLARSPRRTRTREQLTGLLWADKPESAARHSLNEALRVLRRTGGDDVVTAQGDQITLSHAAVELDVDQLERLAGAGDLAAASSLIIGPFLEGFSVPGESGFEDWVAADRQHWSDRSAGILGEHARQLMASGRLDEAAEAAERALRINPVAEPVLESLMRTLSLRGQRVQALERYERYVTFLQERLGAKPSLALQQLAERVRQSPGRPAKTYPDGSADESARRRLPLVARETELRELLAQWEASRRGAVPHAVVVLGDIGTGKTRLVEEVAARVRLEGAVVGSARAVDADQQLPESGILTLLSSKALLESPGVAAAPPAAIATLAARIPIWAERFPGVRTAGGVDGAPQPLGRAVSEIIRAMAEEHPVLLWVDDAQFLDRASLSDIEALLRDGAGLPLMVVLGVSPHPERAEVSTLRARLGRDIPGGAIELGPLKQEAIKALAAYVLPSFSSAGLERVSRRVATDSAGLPLLVVELLHAVANGLELEGGEGAWPEPLRTLSQTLPGDLPDSISAAIRVSLRRLSPDAQSVLAACSVLSERVLPRDLVQVLPLSATQVVEALDELEWARWLVAEPRGYGFLARIIRDVVARDMLTPGQRLRLTQQALDLGLIPRG